MSITMRGGSESVVTRNGRLPSMPTAHASTASNPPVPTSSTTDGRVGREPVRPRVGTRRGLLREVGVEGRLHPDPQHGCTLHRDLVAGPSPDDGRSTYPTSYPGTPFANSKTTRSYPSCARGADVGQQRGLGDRRATTTVSVDAPSSGAASSPSPSTSRSTSQLVIIASAAPTEQEHSNDEKEQTDDHAHKQ